MPDIVWPPTLPLPTVQGYSVQPEDAILRTEMEAGLTEVSADTSRVTGRARMLDVGNKAFPAETYNSLRFSGLTR